MDNRRTRRLLIVAFAVSLIVHAFVALGLHWTFPTPSEEASTTVHIDKLPRVLHIAHQPKPAPHTPRPLPTAAASPVPSARARSVNGTSGTRGSEGSSGIPSTPSQSAPLPSPSAQSGTACSKNDVPASLASLPSPPDIAPEARAQTTKGIVRVRVRLDDHGTVLDAAVAEGSGNGSLDLVALSLAKSAQYNPALHLCKPIPAEYIFTTQFAPF